MKITDLVSPKYIAANWNENAESRPPFLGEMFFPYTTQLSTELAYIKGGNGVVKPLMLSAYDAKAIPVDREGFEKLEKEMPFFKNSLIVPEKIKRELMNVVASGNTEMINIVMNKIYNDSDHLIERANVTREMMRMQALTTGVVNFSSNGQTISIDYGMPNDNKVTPTVDWATKATATPVADIMAWKNQVVNSTGITPTNILMNSTTFALISQADSIRKAFNITDSIVFIADPTIKQYIKAQTGLDVIIYDKVYKDLNNKVVKFVPDYVVVLAPNTVGNTVMSPTPEEYDLMNSNMTKAQVEIVDNGIAITTAHEIDPVVLVTKASMIALPSFELADSVIIATVHSV